MEPPIFPLKRPKIKRKKNTEAETIQESILDAYDASTFRGPAFVLPGGAVASEDTWRDSLEMRLDDLTRHELHLFSLVDFIHEKVNLEGTKLQKKQLESRWWSRWPKAKAMCKAIRSLVGW